MVPTAKKLLAKIPERLREVRTYHAPLGYYDYLVEYYQGLERIRPNPSVIHPEYDRKTELATVADMAVVAVGEQRELATSWGFPLPADYLDFCHVFEQYVLVTRNGVHLLHAEEIVETTDGLREGESVPKTSPHRLFRFAKIIGEPANFAFRWWRDENRMDIAFANYSLTTEADLFGPEADVHHSDDTFTEWFERMLATDGYPLVPGKYFEDDAIIQRVS